jgi:hypothetical protein
MKRIIRIPSLILAGTAAVALGAHSANAANSIAWGTPQNITGPSDVSTSGILVDAGDITSTISVNTVPFDVITGPGSGATDAYGHITVQYSGFAGAATTGLTGSYATILSNEVHGTSSGAPETITLSGLTVGHQYQIEYWANDFGDTAFKGAVLSGSPSVSLLSDNPSNSGGLGQFSIGTYVADASSLSFTYSEPSGLVAVIDAIQLRDQGVSVPEPSVWILDLLGGALVLVWSQRRRLRKVCVS